MTFAENIKRLTFFVFFYTVLTSAFGQGAWQPTGADLSYPRTLLKASELAAVQQSLQTPERNALYASVYDLAIATPDYMLLSVPGDAERDLRRQSAQAAKNTAFVRLVNLHPYNNLQPLTATESAQLESNAIALLEHMNVNVAGSAISYTDWQWRSKELIDYLIAYDLLLGAGVPASSLQNSKANLQLFATNLYTKATTPIFGSITFVSTVKNNHLLMTASALGMAGIVLNDATGATSASQPQSWINVGMYAVDNVMWRDAQRQSEAGVVAGYAEGPYYFKYAMLNCLPFFRTFGNFLPAGNYNFTWNTTTRSIPNPYYDPNYDLLYQWIAGITMPDGRLPALEDSYIDMAMPELAITGKAQYAKTFYPQNLEDIQLNSLREQLDGTVDMRANYLASNLNPLTETEKALTTLPSSGNLVFRSGNGFTGKYLHVYGKNGKPLSNSGGHNHGDASSFSLYAHGQLLALDAGYLNATKRDSVGNPANHNLVLVNGSGPLIGTAGSANDAAAYIQNASETPNLAYGEVKTTYSGATITRKTLSVRGEYYLMADFVSAASPQNFTWQLHGYGLENGTAAQGTFTGNLTTGEGTWQKNGVSLRTRVTATDGATSFTTGTNIHEITYDKSGRHTTFFANKNSVSETQFLAALMPYTHETPATVTLNLNGMAGMVKTSAAFTDLVFSKADTLLKTVSAEAFPQPLQSDANFTFYSQDVDNMPAQVLLQNGTAFFVGSEQLLSSSKRANILLEQTATGNYNIFTSKATTLQIKMAAAPNMVTGNDLTSWNYNSTNQTLEVTLSQPTAFKIQALQGALPVELVYFKAKKVTNAVQLNWQTASEKNSRRFAVQRSADARTWENIASLAGQGTTPKTTSYSYRDAPDFSGKIYYRLQQEDFDGSRHYSPVQVVTFEKSGFNTLAVYPNPATETLHVKTGTATGEKAEIKILSLNRTEVFKAAVEMSGNAIDVPVAALQAGFYLVSVQTADGIRQAKFIKR